MRRVSGLTSSPIQTFDAPIGDGTTVVMTLRYMPTNQMFFLNLTYDDVTLNGIRVCGNVNLLRQYRNRVPFGLFVQCPDETEPFLINDFSSGRCYLNILTADEVDSVEALIQEAAD